MMNNRYNIKSQILEILNESNQFFDLVKHASKLPKQYTNKEKDIKNIKIDDIEFEEKDVNYHNTLPLDVKFRDNEDLSNSVSFEIQVINDKLYQPHIYLDKSVRGNGLATKIYIAFIKEFGHLYFSTKRRQNDLEIPKIIDKLKTMFKYYKINNEEEIIYSDEMSEEDIINLLNQ